MKYEGDGHGIRMEIEKKEDGIREQTVKRLRTYERDMRRRLAADQKEKNTEGGQKDGTV